VETTTVEQETEDHESAVANPVVFIGDIDGTPLDVQRRRSADGESSGMLCWN